MSAGRGISIGNFSEASPGWGWIRDKVDQRRRLDWRFYPVAKPGVVGRAIRWRHGGLLGAASRLRRDARRNALDLIVSHLPYCTTGAAGIAGRARPDIPHLAFTFHFTDLPTGWRRALMARAFQRVHRFVVFSQIERRRYADHFGLPVERFDWMRWGVAKPIEAPGEDVIGGAYFAAVGGYGRDYRTLCAAARLLPSVTFVLVAWPHSIEGIDVPPNVRVLVNIPWREAWTLVHHAKASIVPIRDGETPCGHITIVGGMHLGKAHVVTSSTGVADYVEHERTALLAAPNDPVALARAIERLLDEPALARRLGEAGRRFAAEHCTEATTVRYFESYLDETFGPAAPAAAA